MTLDYEHKIDRLKEVLEESDEFSERNNELLLEFERDLRLKDYSSARIYKLLSTLRVIAKHRLRLRRGDRGRHQGRTNGTSPRLNGGALERLEDRYEELCNPDSPLGEAAGEALERIRSTREKLDPELSGEEAAPEVEEGGFIYLYLPDGIRDRELEEELDSKIPETDDPEADSFFWSNKFSNFVVRSKFAREVEEAVKERYGEDVELNREPDWARKPNTWQIKNENPGRESQRRSSTS